MYWHTFNMKRRNFFTLLTGIVGLVTLNKVTSPTPSFSSVDEQPSSTKHTYVSNFRNQIEFQNFYGEQVCENLEKLRGNFFDLGKLLSLKKFSKAGSLGINPQLHIELIFDSVSSKK